MGRLPGGSPHPDRARRASHGPEELVAAALEQAQRKDRLEQGLNRAVCAGRMALRTCASLWTALPQGRG